MNKTDFRRCRIVNVAVPTDDTVKFKGSEKGDKFLDIAREQKKKKKQWNMKVVMEPIVIGALGTITKGSVKDAEGIRNQLTSRENPNY